jgi:hypothetical protein
MAVHTHIILHARICCALNMGAVAYYNGHVINSFTSWEVVASQASATKNGLLLLMGAGFNTRQYQRRWLF